jgi:RTX calcium-binding nonapeptide repeat (4 copies)
MRFRWVLALAAGLALAVPAVSVADHIVTSANVSARLKERRSADFWTVEIDWGGSCSGAAPGKAWFGGDIYMIDADSGERIYVGGVVSTSGASVVSGTRDWFVSSGERPKRLFPELTLRCYENSPLHGGREAVVTGSSVLIPQAVSGGGGGGGGGGDFGSSGDPTAPVGSGGCSAAVVGTDDPDTLSGGAEGEVFLALGGGDRVDGAGGHDCLLGYQGGDVLRGQAGQDRLTGGRGADLLVGGPGVNAYDAGPGRDVVQARNGKRELVRCGSGRDRAVVDRRDRVRACERVSRPG